MFFSIVRSAFLARISSSGESDVMLEYVSEMENNPSAFFIKGLQCERDDIRSFLHLLCYHFHMKLKLTMFRFSTRVSGIIGNKTVNVI